MSTGRLPISALANVTAGGGAPQDRDVFSQDGHPFVRAGSLPRLAAGASDAFLERLRPEIAKTHNLKLFPTDTVVFAKSGMSATKGHIWRLREPSYLVNHLAALVPLHATDGPFLEQALRWHSPTKLIRDIAYPSIRISDIRAFTITASADPAERLQRARLLQSGDRLKAQRVRGLALVRELRTSVFVEMFGAPGANPMNWSSEKLANLIEPGDKINYGVLQPGSEVDGGVPLVRVSDLVNGRVVTTALKRIDPLIDARHRRSRLKGHELLVSCVGSVGVVALADDALAGCNIARAVARVPLSGEVDRVFVAEYLRSAPAQRFFKKEVRTVSQPTLNIKQLAEIKVLMPPLPRQQEFARRVSAIDRLSLVHSASLERIDTLVRSLQARTFGTP